MTDLAIILTVIIGIESLVILVLLYALITTNIEYYEKTRDYD